MVAVFCIEEFKMQPAIRHHKHGCWWILVFCRCLPQFSCQFITQSDVCQTHLGMPPAPYLCAAHKAGQAQMVGNMTVGQGANLIGPEVARDTQCLSAFCSRCVDAWFHALGGCGHGEAEKEFPLGIVFTA